MSTGNPFIDAVTRARALAAVADPAPHVLLIYDLHGAVPAVYARLDHELRSLQYTKVVEDTTWEGRYRMGVTFDAAMATTQREFQICAMKAGAARYDLRIYGAPSIMRVANVTKP